MSTLSLPHILRRLFEKSKDPRVPLVILLLADAEVEKKPGKNHQVSGVCELVDGVEEHSEV